ncbi:XylR N-terminal domain-containing protein [Oceanobacillus salinisoli]|uniref:XylR N-terminal domain-containing protein n=1 Tax=Oceanobacillus salinisoli TaxID=2678611 RepID=UPI0018CC5176|nr:XylR N-terminal domain-containing protein [Oceanobacillus salinisoli]
MNLEDIKIEKFYKRITDPGFHRKDHERIISITTNTIGTLRKELVDTIGQDRTKGFLLRYGWHAGATDARKMITYFGEQAEELTRAGPKMHVLHGWTEDIDILINNIDYDYKKLQLKAIWKKSYEAEEYKNTFGESNHTVCHTMAGYASGYLSTILNHQVIVVEEKCEAKGDDYCQCICRTVEEWGEEIASEVKYFEPNSLISELQLAYDELKVERDNLKKAYQAHELMMNEVNSSNNIPTVIRLLNEIVDKPAMMIDNFEGKIVAAVGEDQFDMESSIRMDNDDISTTELLLCNGYQRMITPVYVQQQIVGYCCLIFHENVIPTELDRMILERAAIVCGSVLLNEKTSLDTKQKIGGDFLEEILSGKISEAELNKRAYYLGFEKMTPFFIITLGVSVSLSVREKIELNEKIIDEIYFYFESGRRGKGRRVLIEQKAEKIVILCYQDATLNSCSKKEKMLEEIIKYCQQRFRAYLISGGISSCSDSLNEASAMYRESLAALKVTSEKCPIISYERLGVEGILFQLEENKMMNKMIDKSLGKLLSEDKDMELTKTLYFYLKNGCNVHQTARSMNFSVSGLRYRLQRINELLETKVNNPNVTYQLFLALKALIFLGKLEIDMDINLLEEQDV